MSPGQFLAYLRDAKMADGRPLYPSSFYKSGHDGYTGAVDRFFFSCGNFNGPLFSPLGGEAGTWAYWDPGLSKWFKSTDPIALWKTYLESCKRYIFSRINSLISGLDALDGSLFGEIPAPHLPSAPPPMTHSSQYLCSFPKTF